MRYLIPFNEIELEDKPRVGGKAFALSELIRAGLDAPDGVAVTIDAYDKYVGATGLRERIQLELNRKPFADMRWEELWDAALRIRNLFIKTAFPSSLKAELRAHIETRFGNTAVAVRSSAPDEDSAKASFAGLHESYVNIRGADAILEHIQLVWASLWSDRALLYRRELGLDVRRSVMAVVVQELVIGDKSGVVFGRSPDDPDRAMIEAVHGLNQGLVDGTVQPDRWTIERATGNIVSHFPVERREAMLTDPNGVSLQPLPSENRERPPLDNTEVGEVFRLALRSEKHFENPQDVEWTYRKRDLYALQSRPITSASSESGDQRLWYISLTRSFENLKNLRRRIEDELIPAMDREATKFADTDMNSLNDIELASEIERRADCYEGWKKTYWDEFIPFAHGARLFGQCYNDAVRPSDPFEFTRLLGATDMISLKRNRELERLAGLIRADTTIAANIREGRIDSLDADFKKSLETFADRFGIAPAGSDRLKIVSSLLLEMAARPEAKPQATLEDVEQMTEKFLSRFEGEKRKQAEEMLDLGRASYRLRDNDNIHLKAVEDEYLRAVEEGRRRITAKPNIDAEKIAPSDIPGMLRDLDYNPASFADEAKDASENNYTMRPRQLTGQPAGPGIAVGEARVINDPSDLFKVKSGEVIICDAVDPNMTFVVPLASAIVERRGGMLIHGAIIAREYGIPCVTGVTDATSLIWTGARVTVDGYLGIVTVSG